MNVLTGIGLVVAFLVIIISAIYQWVSKKPLRRIQNRHVVVTGGSSGIGFWIAVKCIKLGAHVTIIARSVEKLEFSLEQLKTHKVSDTQLIQYRSIDLSKSYESVEKSLAELEEEVAPIYMLVNCVGGAIYGDVDTISRDDAVYLMNINYFSVYYPTRYVLAKFKQTGDGIMTVIASQASLLDIHGLGPYAAAKFALRGLCESIAMEVSNTNISITLALTASKDTLGFENENLTKPEETKTISGGSGLAKPEDMTEKILTDSLRGEFHSILGLKSWLLAMFWFAEQTSSIFSPNKNQEPKSKLAMILSFLHEKKSKDTVGSDFEKPSASLDKSVEKDETQSSSPSSSANFSTITSVTFSTAPVTSLPNLPSDTTKSSLVEPPKNDENATSESTSSSSGLTLSTSAPTPSTTVAATITTTSQNDELQESTENAINSVPLFPAMSTKLFTFGAVDKTENTSIPSVTPPSVTDASNTFIFGSKSSSSPNPANISTDATTDNAFQSMFSTNVTPLMLKFGVSSTTQSAFAFSANKPNTEVKSTFAPKFDENKNSVPPTFGDESAKLVTSASSASLFGGSQITPVFGSSNVAVIQSKTENIFGSVTNQAKGASVLVDQNSTGTVRKSSKNEATFGSSNTNNIRQAWNDVFGSTTGAPQVATTAALTGIFDSSKIDTSSNGVFTFGQSNKIQSLTTGQSNGASADTKPAKSAPPALGSTLVAQSVIGKESETKPIRFSFNASNNTSSFGSTSAAAVPPQFGAKNGIGSSFSFGLSNQPEATKSFNFSGPATVLATSLNQFSATTQPTTNVFNVGRGTSFNTAKTGRPARTAVRRMK